MVVMLVLVLLVMERLRGHFEPGDLAGGGVDEIPSVVLRGEGGRRRGSHLRRPVRAPVRRPAPHPAQRRLRRTSHGPLKREITKKN